MIPGAGFAGGTDTDADRRTREPSQQSLRGNRTRQNHRRYRSRLRLPPDSVQPGYFNCPDHRGIGTTNLTDFLTAIWLQGSSTSADNIGSGPSIGYTGFIGSSLYLGTTVLWCCRRTPPRAGGGQPSGRHHTIPSTVERWTFSPARWQSTCRCVTASSTSAQLNFEGLRPPPICTRRNRCRPAAIHGDAAKFR